MSSTFGTLVSMRRVNTLALLVGLVAAGCGNGARPGGNGDDDDTSAQPDATPGAPDGGSDPGAPDASPTAPDATPGAPDAMPIEPDAAVPPMPAWTELVAPAVSLAGGEAQAPSGHAMPGGQLHLVSRGGITFDVTIPTAPVVPATPADAVRPTSLGADLSAPGSIVIEGVVASSGAEAERVITASGDIFVVGTLRAGDLGTGRQSLRLVAGGSIYVTGLIDASGDPIAGTSAGAISLRSTHDILITGVVDVMGGDAIGDGDVIGGSGGTLTVQVGGDLTMVGTTRVRGGAAISTAGGAQGGPAGTTIINADGAVVLGGVLDTRGGVARTDTTVTPVTAGAAGALRIGETAAPTRIDVVANVVVSGGAGGAVGGDGGIVNLQPRAGDLRIDARLEASGGASATLPGVGGHIDGHPGPDTTTVTTAGVVVGGAVVANGGSVTAGANGSGGAAGVIKLVVISTDGGMVVNTSGVVQVDGGRSAGTGTGGPAGLAYLFTRNGNASIGGHLFARGGDAPDAGGTGGTGGLLYVFTDDDHGGPGPGNLVVETDGVLDASGGAGTIGGSGRNDGADGSVASWPVSQTDEYAVEQIGVLLNSDGVHGGATGSLDNQGLILTRGGHSNGSGGDVFFHGRDVSGSSTPQPGRIDDSGDGTGSPGTFGGKYIIIVGPTF
jgi:hypothetical protein